MPAFKPAFNPVAFGSIISTLLLSDRVQFVSYRTVLDNRVYHLPSTFALNGTLNPTGCTSRRFDLQPFQSDRIGLPTISLHIHILVPYAPYTLMQQPTRLISNQIFQVSVNLRYSGRLYDYQPNPSHFLWRLFFLCSPFRPAFNPVAFGSIISTLLLLTDSLSFPAFR